MGRITKAKARLGASDATSNAAVKPPTMKFAQAAKMADKNARTMMKISQLMEVLHLPGHAEADPQNRIGAHIATLKARLNKRLQRLARWADSSADERHSEFRTAQHGSGYPYRTLVKPMIYSKPFALTSGPASPAPVSRLPTTASTGTNIPLVTLGRVHSSQPAPIPIGLKTAAPSKLIL